MDRQAVLEFLRMILIAFVIAMVINFFRVLIFQNGDFRGAFLRTNNTNNETVDNTNMTSVQNEKPVNEDTSSVNIDSDEDIIDIPISPLKELSGLTKDEILKLRIDAIKTSPIFSNDSYTPSEEVFRIDDGMPWISADAALNWDSRDISQVGKGVSRESAGILNPELLYYISISQNTESRNIYKNFYFLPYRAVYNTKTNTITAYIKNDRNPNGNYQQITLADTNAHDLGYKYAYMDSYSNIGFYTDEPYKNNTLNSGIKEITGWYMHGPACGVPGGCNNYAPYWQYYNYFFLRNLPASVHIKLWKQRPQSINQEADINFRMVFE